VFAKGALVNLQAAIVLRRILGTDGIDAILIVDYVRIFVGLNVNSRMHNVNPDASDESFHNEDD